MSSDYTTNESADDIDDDLSILPADIAVMRRLVKKANLLPVIARADSLTDDMLARIKKVVRRDLEAAGLDLGVFAPIKAVDTPGSRRDSHVNGNGHAESHGDAHAHGENQNEDNGVPEEEDDRRSRPVIKLRGTRRPFKMPWTRSRSRTRLEETEPVDEPTSTSGGRLGDFVASARGRRTGAYPDPGTPCEAATNLANRARSGSAFCTTPPDARTGVSTASRAPAPIARMTNS